MKTVTTLAILLSAGLAHAQSTAKYFRLSHKIMLWEAGKAQVEGDQQVIRAPLRRLTIEAVTEAGPVRLVAEAEGDVVRATVRRLPSFDYDIESFFDVVYRLDGVPSADGGALVDVRSLQLTGSTADGPFTVTGGEEVAPFQARVDGEPKTDSFFDVVYDLDIALDGQDEEGGVAVDHGRLWALRIVDTARADTGKLESWSLTLEGGSLVIKGPKGGTVPAGLLELEARIAFAPKGTGGFEETLLTSLELRGSGLKGPSTLTAGQIHGLGPVLTHAALAREPISSVEGMFDLADSVVELTTRPLRMRLINTLTRAFVPIDQDFDRAMAALERFVEGVDRAEAQGQIDAATAADLREQAAEIDSSLFTEMAGRIKYRIASGILVNQRSDGGARYRAPRR